MRRNLLMLVHRIPYPPNKGDKIRSYHLLRHLTAGHDVHLGAFVDDPHDWAYREPLERLCASLMLVPLKPATRRISSLRGFLSGEALSLPYYRDPRLQRWVDEAIERHRIADVIVFSSTMAQYVQGERYARLRRIADLCDVDSDKWRQYAEGKHGPTRWLYAREARKLVEVERAIAREFDATLFVTSAEADLFRSLAPESATRIGHYDNGVDTDYFDPGKHFDSPYGVDAHNLGAPVVVFTGAMDYWANVDAVQWFVREIWPLVRATAPDARFFIVGSNPSTPVRELQGHRGVHVVGRVPDMRPWLAHADVAVAPLRIARGTQNKVLEALAMARPVVCTNAAASGLDLPAGGAFRVHDDPTEFAAAVLALAGAGRNPAGRSRVTESFAWSANLRTVDRLLETPTPA